MTPRTPRRTPGSRALRLVPVALAAVVGLGACSAAGDPSAAAVVDGRVVSERDVQTAVEELPLELTGGARVDPVQVVSLLVARDVVAGVAREASEGAPASLVVSDAQAQEILAGIDTEAGRDPGTYSQPTLDVISTNYMFTNIRQSDAAGPALQEAFTELEQSDVTVNPRYGQIGEDGVLAIGDFQKDWLPVQQQEGEGTPEAAPEG